MQLPQQLLGVLGPVAKVEGSPVLVAAEGVSAGGQGLLPTWIHIATVQCYAHNFRISLYKLSTYVYCIDRNLSHII